MRDRYLCQFQDVGKDHFITDCAFQDGQFDKAIAYIQMIVNQLATVARGQVYDQASKQIVYRFP